MGVDADLLKGLAARCSFLLDQYEAVSPSKRPLIVGAVRYFAVADDPFDDETFSSGLFDDVRVVNYVLEELGFQDQCLDVA